MDNVGKARAWLATNSIAGQLIEAQAVELRERFTLEWEQIRNMLDQHNKAAFLESCPDAALFTELLDETLKAAPAAVAARAKKRAEEAKQTAADEMFTGPHAADTGPYPLMRYDADVIAPPRLTLVDGVLGVNGMSLWIAGPDEGKTTVLLDMGLAIAHGNQWHGRPTHKGSVLYCCFERADDMPPRLHGNKQHLPLRDPDSACFAYLDLEGQTLTKGTAQRIAASGLQLAENSGHTCALIVVDTLSAAIGGADENNPKDIGAFNSWVRWIKAQTRAHLAVAHHFGKDRSKGERGHSKLRGDFDALFELDGASIKPVKLKGRKSTMHYQSVAVGLPNGDTSVVMREVAKAEHAERPREPKAGGKEARLLAIIDAAGAAGIGREELNEKAQTIGNVKELLRKLRGKNCLLEEAGRVRCRNGSDFAVDAKEDVYQAPDKAAFEGASVSRHAESKNRAENGKTSNASRGVFDEVKPRKRPSSKAAKGGVSSASSRV
jgi:hypothetical protein